MYHREHPTTPSQEATNGGLSIFIEGCQKDNVPQQLFGLSILRSATEAQVHTAISLSPANRGVTPADIHALLARS